jgi:lipoprotein-anchoring transpeptidase ErfK/SrfK
MSPISTHQMANCAAAAALSIAGVLFAGTAWANPLGYAPSLDQPGSVFGQVLRDRGNAVEPLENAEIPARLRRQVVGYQTHEPAGSIVIDTPNTYLYYVLGGGRAIRYGIGVGREGFTWSGVQAISRKSEWPDWIPPAEMLARQPYLPRFMAGGPGNPLGARAMYLGGTIYRIHGTNQPQTIGGQVSSGCIRMLNDDVVDLYARVNIGTKVVVLPARPRMRSEAAASDRPVAPASSIAATGSGFRAFALY